MNIGDVHAYLAKEVLEKFPGEDNALAIMVLFHTHCLRLKEPILEDRPGVVDVDAITQRHAAEILAASWPDRNDKQRTLREYWYYQFNIRTPYEVVEDIPPDLMLRVQELCNTIAGSPIVSSLRPED